MNVVVVNGIPWGIWKARQQLGFPFAFNGYSHVCLAGSFCVFSPLPLSSSVPPQQGLEFDASRQTMGPVY